MSETANGLGKEPGGARFRAFVSYSHADAKIARRLQRRLERYRVPSRLKDRVRSLDSFAPGRVGRVFRDREDLPAGEDLSEAVRDAIARSEALVIVCTPNAARSQWVAREIELFRLLHPSRPILAALFDGEPDQAIPPSLRAGDHEPLAADFRRHRDGPRLAFLKIVAGLLAVPLDELVQRDAQARLRRVIAVTVAAFLALLVLSVMTILAIQSRREAERQRAEAEGLVEFMLTDLRQQLKAVGRLDVMDGVNQRAMTYYAHQGDPAELEDGSLEQRARIIGAMGEDAENRGRFGLARTRYAALYRTTSALLAKEPGDPERVFAHAQSENRLALLALAEGRSAEARMRFDQTRASLDSITRWGRGRTDWTRLSAYARGNSCATSIKRKEISEAALRDCEQAVDFSKRLLAMRPDDSTVAYDLVFHLLWLAEAQLGNGRESAAKRSEAECLRLLGRMIEAEPENMFLREQEMEVYTRFAELLQDEGRSEAARDFLDRAVAVNARLMARDPSNARWSQFQKRLARLRSRGG